MVREGIVRIVQEAGGYEVVAQGASAEEALAIVATGNVDVLFLDLNIPGSGLNALRDIAATGQATRLVILTVSEDADDVLNAFKNGANAYLLKGISGGDLLKALASVIQDGAYVSPVLGARILSGRRHSEPAFLVETDVLTPRERDIHDRVRRGLSNKEIARELDLSEKTIKHYMTKIFLKLNVTSRLTLALLRRQ